LRQRWPILVLGAAIAVATVLMLHLGRGQTLVVDQWGYLYSHRSWSPGSLLSPHNGHLIVLGLLVYKGLYSTFGIDSQLPFQLVTLALSATVATLLCVLIRNAVGELLALAAAILVLFYGAGADAILPTSQIPNLISLASGLAMLLVLRRGDMRGDLLACLFLAMSLASFSVGTAFALGAAVMLAFRPPGERLARLWVVALPVIAYVAWDVWARQHGDQTIYVHNLKILGSAFADQLGAVLSGLTGLFTTPNGPPAGTTTTPIRTVWAPALVVGLAAIAIARLRRQPPLGANAIAAIVVLVAYFLLVGIALSPARNTFDQRLVYLGSVLTLLAVAELLAPYRPGRTALIAIGVAFVFSICANVAELGDSAKPLRAESASNRAKLAAVEIAGPAAPADAAVEEPPDDMAFSVGIWRELKAEVGSPAYSEAELRTAPPPAREDADEELVSLLGIAQRPTASLEPTSAGERIEVSLADSGTVEQRGSCVSLVPLPDTAMTTVLEVPQGGIAYSSTDPVALTLGRFADATSVALPARAGDVVVRFPADSSPAPWVASLETTRPTLLCAVGSLT
jgi:hypothetical protein